MVVKFQCKICNKAVANNHHAIQGDKCHLSDAIKSIYQHIDIFSNMYTPGIAKNVLKILSHSLTSQIMIYLKPTLVKKIRFKALTRKQNFQNQDIIEKLNNAMDDPEAEILSSQYFEPHELTPLLKNKESLSFFHLNISSLPFHFEEFSTFLSPYNKVIIICICRNARMNMCLCYQVDV